jgi:hypothetical protein
MQQKYSQRAVTVTKPSGDSQYRDGLSGFVITQENWYRFEQQKILH